MFINAFIDCPCKNGDSETFDRFLSELKSRLKGATIHANDVDHKLQITCYLHNQSFVSQMDVIKNAVLIAKRIVDLKKTVVVQYTCHHTGYV